MALPGDVKSRSGSPVAAEQPRRAILDPANNCWKIASADRAAVLVDTGSYFAALESSMRKARRSITILGWAFDHRIRLLRPRDGSNSPQLGALLRELVEARPELEIRILVWSAAVFYRMGSAMPFLWRSGWQDHPRIHLKLDMRHLFYAAHHQKIVVVDDHVAFAGGMDLTAQRWDTPRHATDDPRRVNPDGEGYGPVHDTQMVVEGEAAAALAELARRRWLRATGEQLLPLPDRASAPDLWPDGVTPAWRDTDVAIARTESSYRGSRAVTEAAKLADDALAAAARTIYIEVQYMTSSRIGDVLERRLREPDGPEIVVLMTHLSRGLMERLVMGTNRDRLIRRLKRADLHGRLRICFPCVPGPSGARQVMVHSKLIIVDDRFLRVGSSNLNNRSIGLDTECDLAIEATDEHARAEIERLRDRLLAEHLDCEPQTLARTIQREGSLVAAIDRLNTRPRGLRPFEAMSDAGPDTPVFGTAILDPERPFGATGN